MFIYSRRFGSRPVRGRWMLPAAVSALAATAALLQLTPWALFAEDRTGTLAGMAAGMVLTTAVLSFILRRADKGEQPR